MKKSLRIFVLALALLMLLPAIVACGGGDDPAATTVQGGNTPGGTNPDGSISTDPSQVSTLPEMDWGGDTFYILGRDGGTAIQMTNFEIWRENMPGDVVGDAVWTRNQNLLTKYNFVVEQELVDNPYSEAQTLYDAQDDIYDVVIYKPINVFNHAAQGYLLDLNNVDYINFNHNTWSSYVNTELSIAGKLYATTNKFLLQDKARTYTLFYNRELSRQHGLGNLEDHVDNNTWTLEEFEKCARTTVFDINGGGPGHLGDSFGIFAEGHASFAVLLYGAGFKLGSNDGYEITLEGATSHNNDIVTAAGKIWFDKTVTAVPNDFTPLDYYVGVKQFNAQLTLFELSFPSDFDVAGGFNEACNFEFGVLPFPKYDSNQERYYNQNNFHNSSLVAIPYTVADPAQVGFYLEAISEEAVDTTYTAYIDSKCKVQDSYDELTAKMLDMCFDNITFDIIACLDPGGIYTIISDQVPSFRTNIFVRLYNSKGDKPETELADIMDTFESLDA